MYSACVQHVRLHLLNYGHLELVSDVSTFVCIRQKNGGGKREGEMFICVHPVHLKQGSCVCAYASERECVCLVWSARQLV